VLRTTDFPEPLESLFGMFASMIVELQAIVFAGVEV
jgi:hypothetical protein